MRCEVNLADMDTMLGDDDHDDHVYVMSICYAHSLLLLSGRREEFIKQTI